MFRLTILLLFSPIFLFAQNGNSPYSRYGLGDPLPNDYIQNTGMGGVGIGIPSPFNININPAFLPHNKYTAFEFAAQGEYKRLSTTQNSVTDGNGSLKYLSFAFPIAKNYTLNVGLKPLTNVSYNYSHLDFVSGGSSQLVNYRYFGEGGINSIYLSQGLQITDYLSIGLKTAYNFGAIEKSYSSYIENIGQPYYVQVTNQTNYSGFLLGPAIGFRKKMNKDWYINAGGMYEIASKWNYTNVESLEKISLVDDDQLDNSSIGAEEAGKISYPTTITAGFGFEKLYKIALGAEFRYQDWSSYEPIENTESLKDITTISVGGQYVPNLNAMKGYLNRVIYRFGGYYSESTFMVSSEPVTDIGGTLGLSLPVGRLSFVNFAFSAGKKGNKTSNLIEENYYRFSLGITINDRWFVRSKYD